MLYIISYISYAIYHMLYIICYISYAIYIKQTAGDIHIQNQKIKIVTIRYWLALVCNVWSLHVGIEIRLWSHLPSWNPSWVLHLPSSGRHSWNPS